ncbi:MAG: hypothetical protein KJ626_10350 [Verrucomicrobia bacterium]|nr:hypothetical protein [Verrucomicrobiota bacterium]
MKKRAFLVSVVFLIAAGSAQAATEAYDAASDAVYNDGWQNSDNGGSGWGGSWSFQFVGSYGTFIGSSTNNGDGDTNSDGDIDESDESWGLYANTGGRVFAVRPFGGSLSTGQTVHISLDNGNIDSGSEVGVRLLYQLDASANKWEFSFTGGGTNYVFTDTSVLFSSRNSSIPFSDEGIELAFTLVGPSNYSLAVTTLENDQLKIYNGTLGNTNAIVGLAFFNDDAGTGADKDAFFNSIGISNAPVINYRAKDEAADTAYSGGWTNGSDGGTGFGPWIMMTNIQNAGEAAGFFRAVNDTGVDNDDMNYVGTGSPPYGWGIYANEAGTGGDDIQIAGGFRSFNSPLAVGETFSISFEHAGIQSGSLNANNPPRTGGWVGFALRSLSPPQQFDPDPISAFATLQNAEIMLGFRGGNANYTLYDGMNTAGVDTGVPYSEDGVEVAVTLTASNRCDVTIAPLNGGTPATLRDRVISGTPLQYAALYNRNAEEANAYFNSMGIIGFDPAFTNCLAEDSAADSVYAAGWNANSNGGYGFEPWLFGTNTGSGGAAGHFTATNTINTDLNNIATEGKAWGMYASDSGGGGVQAATAQRSFTRGALKQDQTFKISFEHGGISAVNGEVEIVLIGTPTFPNPQGHVLTFQFVGGDSIYEFYDANLSAHDTGIGFTTNGLRIEFTLTSDEDPYDFDLDVIDLGSDTTHSLTGTVASIPKALKVLITDIEDADVFVNSLCIQPAAYDLDGDSIPDDWENSNGLNANLNDADDDNDFDGESNFREYIADTSPINSNDFFRAAAPILNSPAEIAFDSSTGRVYSLQFRDSLYTGNWINVTGSIEIPGAGGIMSLTNNTEKLRRYYRVGVDLP